MSKYHINMTEGAIFGKLIRFSIPVLLTNLFQTLYNVADTVVVGRFEGKVALAAVGSTGALINLFVLMFSGLAAGAGVVVAQYVGAGDQKKKIRAMGTSLILAFFSGVFLIVAGYFLSRPMLLLMACPKSVLDAATLYMRIYFVGSPASLLYNFGACILRGHGDTKRPMYILSVAGVANVALNLILVIVFKMGVAGVACATVTSQAITAVFVLTILFRPQGEYALKSKEMQFDLKECGRIMKIGIPVGLNSILFSLSNVVIQREVNALGDIAMAGNAAASGLDRFTHLGIASFSQAAISFSGQNVGAKKYRRLDTVLWQSVLSCAVFSAVISLLFVALHQPLLGMFINETGEERSAIIAAALPKLVMVGMGYLLCGTEDILSGMLKGMGKSTVPVVLNIVSVTGVRLLWVFLVFYRFKGNLWVLYGGYPVSWLVSAIAQFAAYRLYRRRIFSNEAEDAARSEKTPGDKT